MDTNEILVNEEIVETAETIVKAGSGKGFKVAAGVGLAVLTGLIAYKYVIKPTLAKIKNKKEQAETGEVVECENFDIYENENEKDETE